MMEVTQPTFSALLIEALHVKDWGVEELAKRTGVSDRFINLLLEERIEDMPSLPYLRGYILKITDVLDLDNEKIWQTYFENNERLRSSGKYDELPKNRFVLSRINKKVVLGVITILIVLLYLFIRVFLAFNLSHALSIPDLEENRVVVYDPSFILRGTIESNYKLILNNEPVYPDIDGAFEQILELQPGFNTFTFEIKGFLGRTDTVVKQLFYEVSEVVEPARAPPLVSTTTDNDF